MKAQGILVLLVSVGVGISAFSCSSSSTPETGAGGTTSSAGGGSNIAASTTKTVAASTGATISGTGGGSATALGATCAMDSDCGAGNGLKCSTSTTDDPVFGGGPASGYCTKSCTTAADCPSQGECVGAAGAMECMLTCTPGPALTYIDDPLDPNKCQGRVDLKCATLTDMTTVCLPSCGEDAQCDGGRVCDPQSNTCVDAAKVHKGDKLGTLCDPTGDAGADKCAGACGQFNFGAPGTVDFCSEQCTLGGQPVTDSTNCGGLEGGLCIFSAGMNGAGDEGFCDPACTTQDDCPHPVTWCRTVNFQMGNGYCLDATACKTDADCMSMADMGTTCTQTKDAGKLCLFAKWPLGKEAPVVADGGAGGGGGGGGGSGDAGAPDAASDASSDAASD